MSSITELLVAELDREMPGTRRFQELMASAQERYQRFTDDGAPTLVRTKLPA